MHLLAEGNTTTHDEVLLKILNQNLIRALELPSVHQRMEESANGPYRYTLSQIQWKEIPQDERLLQQEWKKKSEKEKDGERRVGQKQGTKKKKGTQIKTWINKSILIEINNWIDKHK